MMRVAVVFENSIRPETTGVYCFHAMGELAAAGRILAVEHLRPHDLHSSQADQFDLWLVVDDGLDYDLPACTPPVVWWAIDTHLSFERCWKQARRATWTFCAQKSGAERLDRLGIAVEWLPLACAPAVHGQRPIERTRDVAFVGNMIGEERVRLLQLIQSWYPNSFNGRAYFEDMALAYSSARIGFNRSIADDVNMRVFEVLCSGTMLLTNRLEGSGLSELLRVNEQFVEYSQDEDLFEKLEFYLSHDMDRERIAAAGRAAVLAQHTYRHRMESILSVVERGRVPRVRATVAEKPVEYFEFDRPDVLALVPLHSRRILDVGCGGGRLGLAIKNRQSAHVTGIELQPLAAQRARLNLDVVEQQNIESDPLAFATGTFDCVICADVLEHMTDPGFVLRKLHHWLTENGSLVVSLPNVRHHSVVSSLLAGNWTYEPAGLLDADHLRFFTRREIEKLLFRIGFEIRELSMVPGEGFEAWQQAGRPCEVNIGSLLIRTATSDEAAEFFAYQYLVQANKTSRTTYALTSIIIVTYNQLDYTRQCIDSIRMRTDEPYELIFVDNGSTDGTPEYLESLAGARVIRNSTNRGFPAAVNQGLEIATGQQILLLNNDVIVTTGWLRRLLETLHADSRTGMVGPVSNNVSGPQQVPVSYRQLADLDGEAWDRHSRQTTSPETYWEAERLVGFCLLLKREVVDAIGRMDERFGVGNFEDDDFVRRARLAGFRAVIAHNAFVHHFGSVSFRGAGLDLAKLLTENQRLYSEKWRQEAAPSEKSLGSVSPPPVPAAVCLALKPPRPRFSVEVSEAEHLRLIPNETKVSLCMIVRDNAGTIRPCLESIRPWVDEMIVVDTGSTDQTPQICREMGAQVHHWAWRDDFSAARNESLRYARGEWIFWMDSDDTIPEDAGRKLRALVDQDHDLSILGYVMQVHCPGRGPDDLTVVDHIKLFRNRPDLQFEFRIHEQIIPAIRRAGGEVAWTDIYVVHSGSDQSPEAQNRKRERDFRILQKEIDERPDHPFALFNIGMTHADARQYEQAIHFLKRCVEASGPEESHLRKAYALLVSSLANLNRAEEASAACQRGLDRFPQDKELLFRQATLDQNQGRLALAAAGYRRLLTEQSDRHFASIDEGIDGYKARHNLAMVLEELGEWKEACETWREVTREKPSYRLGWRGLGRALRQLGQIADHGEVEELLASSVQTELRAEAALLQANRLEHLQQFPAALHVLAEAVQASPGDLDVHQEQCRLAFHHAPLSTVVRALERLIQIVPTDASAHHNLGNALLQMGAPDLAIGALERSLELRPESSATVAILESARQEFWKRGHSIKS
ncbi:MAG: glycosyltransferase [Planctomycetota bacterium]|nr:MAG: glycosyltransferase [Planctomycetota bacterium]